MNQYKVISCMQKKKVLVLQQITDSGYVVQELKQ